MAFANFHSVCMLLLWGADQLEENMTEVSGVMGMFSILSYTGKLLSKLLKLNKLWLCIP